MTPISHWASRWGSIEISTPPGSSRRSMLSDSTSSSRLGLSDITDRAETLLQYDRKINPTETMYMYTITKWRVHSINTHAALMAPLEWKRICGKNRYNSNK